MEKRIIVNKTRQTFEFRIEYIAVYESGEPATYSCSSEEWDLYELKTKLIDLGVEENDVEELYSIGYSNGYNETECNAAENEGW